MKKLTAETEAARAVDTERVVEKLAVLRQQEALLLQRQQTVVQLAENIERRDQLHADQIAALKKRLERYQAPSYPFEAEPGIYFLAPAR